MGKIITITKDQLATMIFEQSLAYLYNPYSNKIRASKDSLNSLLSTYGKKMINIENGKDYLVYYAKGISDSIGKQYVICRVININNEPYGSVYIKPLELFKDKY